MIELVCPETHEPLHREREVLTTASGHPTYPVVEGIPDLTYPPELLDKDVRSERLYRLIAPAYNFLERASFRIMAGLSLPECLREVADSVPMAPGESVLEVSPGPGPYQPLLAAKVGPGALSPP